MKNYQNVELIETPSVKVGDSLLDNLFSSQGGIEWANLIFLTGTSGAGKTTLCKKLQSLISEHVSVFYSREMLSSLVKKQTLRLEIAHKNAFIADSKDYPHFNTFMKMIEERGDVKILILDSIQRIAVDFIKDGMPREAAMRHIYDVLTEWKDRTNGIVILIGQLTKDGDFEGASFLKFDADAHVHMIFDDKKNTRTIETTKNRMGKTGKLYYEILDSSETLKFYTEKEFELKGKNYKFDDYLLKTVVEFVSIIDKKHPSYKEFKKEYDSRIAEISKTEVGKSKLEVTIVVANMINEVSKKYGL
jgi:predicted ATP-dependent serine protease